MPSIASIDARTLRSATIEVDDRETLVSGPTRQLGEDHTQHAIETGSTSRLSIIPHDSHSGTWDASTESHNQCQGTRHRHGNDSIPRFPPVMALLKACRTIAQTRATRLASVNAVCTTQGGWSEQSFRAPCPTWAGEKLHTKAVIQMCQGCTCPDVIVIRVGKRDRGRATESLFLVAARLSDASHHDSSLARFSPCRKYSPHRAQFSIRGAHTSLQGTTRT